MTKESILQIFPLNLFVKEAYHVVKVLHKYNGLYRNNRLLILTLKKNIFFVKLFETFFGTNIFISSTELKC